MVERRELKDTRRPRPLSMADLPTYSDGLPYPEPRVVRRPLTQAMGTTVEWITSNVKRENKKAKDKKKAKSLPIDKKDAGSENLLLKLFRRNMSENALESAEDSKQSSSTRIPTSSISSLTSSGFTPSSPPAGSLTSVSSIEGDQMERGGQFSLHKPYLSAPTSPADYGRHQFGMRSASELDLCDPLSQTMPLLDYSQVKQPSHFGSFRDTKVDEADDSGLASETELKLSRQRPHSRSRLPMDAIYIEPRSSEDCEPDLNILSPQQHTIDMLAKFRQSIESLTQKAQNIDSSQGALVSDRSGAAQRRHSSDPTHAPRLLESPNSNTAKDPSSVGTSKGRKSSNSLRPLSLIEPLDWMSFGSLPRRKHHQSLEDITTNLSSSDVQSTPTHTRQGRLLTALSTMDVRTPPTVMKVRASASYVDVHLSLKINSEDVSSVSSCNGVVCGGANCWPHPTPTCVT